MKKDIFNGSQQFPVQEVWRRGVSLFLGRPHRQRPRLWPCVSFFSPAGHLLRSPDHSHPCPVRGCCAQSLQLQTPTPLLWTPAKPGEGQRSQGKNLRSKHSPCLVRCCKDRLCACKASLPLKPPACAGAGEGLGDAGRERSHQKTWKDSTKAVTRNLGLGQSFAGRPWGGRPCH